MLKKIFESYDKINTMLYGKTVIFVKFVLLKYYYVPRPQYNDR